ncbi:hypothetical protein IGI04_021403 [Brassica rapa subsp. trilocularis]|uniref:Sulfhydryl oxidase n=2 Tax=Brassica TaxID=3705 RepID=A0ABQ8CUW2_BRANA|nr:hypothetical protein IGI04_021403 [Brassica rapa subsp. trilocularis]KAH0920859.1 hypothetical protein HID58_020877 [Brassica napus]
MFNFTSYYVQDKSTGPVTKEELGKATWTFLHTLAAQYPEKPTRQQKKDILSLFNFLNSQFIRSSWKSLGKLVYPCERVDARWGKLECEQKSCDLHGTSMDF